MKDKGDNNNSKLYYSISEAAMVTQVKPHVLRYWETQFKALHPRKNKAGNRMYRKTDLKMVMLIKELLYEKGFTIAGAKKKLTDEKDAIRDQIEMKFGSVDRAARLLEVQREIRHMLKDLKGSLDGNEGL
jgi:DNA-binding transcriptional MerR regulator